MLLHQHRPLLTTMQRFLATLLTLTLWCLALPAAMAADAAPMIRLEYRLVAFGIDPNGFEGATRRLWRVGNTQLRYEEPLNPSTGAQLLVVVSMPDAGFIDAAARRGTYRKDSDAAGKVKFPAFAPQFGDEIAKMELGFEQQWFAERNAVDAGERTVQEVDCRLQTVEADGKKVTLFSRKANGLPFQIVVETAERAVAVRFARYERALEVDKALFQPPAGVEIQAEAPAAKQ
ncbi:MAG: hypothetical protein ACK5YP_02180 [Betaproteobacteria bacterium]